MAIDRSASDVAANEEGAAAASPWGAALVGLARAVAREATIDGVLRSTLETLQALFDPRTSFVSVHDRPSDRLVVALARGRADPRVAAGGVSEGPQGQAFQTGELVWAPAARRGARGLCAVPMLAAGRSVGAIVLIGPSLAGDVPSQHERELLDAVAGMAAGAVRGQHLRDEAERHSHEQQNSVEALRVADRDRDQHLAHISHELRTPLQTVKGYLSLALTGALGETTDKQKRGFEIAQRNADRLLHLINDLILTARLRAGQMTLDSRPVGLRSILGEAVALLESDLRAANATFELALGPEAFVRGNRDRLVEACMHLVEQAMRGGGTVTAEISSEGREGELSVHSGDGTLPQAPSQESERAGGVLIARRILDLHGGSLEVRGVGSRVHLRAKFPLYAGAVTSEPDVERRAGEILVVEDDTDCREVLVEALRDAGYAVCGAADGAAALELLRTNHVALVLLDLMLPIVDGRAVLRSIRADEKTKNLPVFVISGAIDSPAGSREAWGERVDGVFEKPIQFQWLLERVRERVEPLAKSGSPTPS